MTVLGHKKSIIAWTLSSVIVLSSGGVNAQEEENSSDGDGLKNTNTGLKLSSQAANAANLTELGEKISVVNKATGGALIGTSLGEGDIPEFAGSVASKASERISIGAAAKFCSSRGSPKVGVFGAVACAGGAIYLNQKAVKEPVEDFTREQLQQRFRPAEPDRTVQAIPDSSVRSNQDNVGTFRNPDGSYFTGDAPAALVDKPKTTTIVRRGNVVRGSQDERDSFKNSDGEYFSGEVPPGLGEDEPEENASCEELRHMASSFDENGNPIFQFYEEQSIQRHEERIKEWQRRAGIARSEYERYKAAGLGHDDYFQQKRIEELSEYASIVERHQNNIEENKSKLEAKNAEVAALEEACNEGQESDGSLAGSVSPKITDDGFPQIKW